MYENHLQIPKGLLKEGGDRLFPGGAEDRTRSNGLKWQQQKFRLEARKDFSTMKRLPREVWNLLPWKILRAC